MATLIISLEKITKSYYIKEEEFPVLKGINFDIKKGEFVALMGPSGSGKSTLLNIIGALDKPTGGNYHIQSKLVSDLSSDELADIRNRYIGFIFQNFNLIPTISALENVALPSFYAGALDYDRAKELLTMVGLADRLNNRPNELSGGQRQRVSIARSLINSPEFILADEPTGNLDSKTGKEIMDLIQKKVRKNYPDGNSRPTSGPDYRSYNLP
ncbi:MAG: ATP-binding protein of ABC transporter [Candidatus Woesebacteria bacterium GW2011_GWA1_37_8]|uniref:ATP-binding protein of ABC transporter n=1 Tax=Candidatus Woesebacteria bacterium GW2011_GWA1_37_8 TaxID=1618546 RepID=A0A0G0HLS3_9BACT|nr:MAG: ATP-binding protein of ABC transporter [Candidatus Woesebacteria bacterium GW2011_GWA1_37_8]